MATKALVLGGGGVTGVAWELGVLAGLAEAGIDLLAADLFVGTSAGSVVAAQVTSGVPLAELYERQLAPATTEVTAKIRMSTLAAIVLAMLRTRDEQAFRRHVGRMALAARTMPEVERRAVIASRLPVHSWPETRLLVPAADAETGEFVVFDRDAGVSLVDAVGASCAVPGVWPPVTIRGRRYIDGGVRSAANADLAAGADRIVVIAPVNNGGGPIARLAAQVAALRRTAAVTVIRPDRAAGQAIGRNVLDPARRAPAARAGRVQGAALAATVAHVWHDAG
ncbi:patatin-like phospholipase family protein [Phytohabitans sp. LJ34]|uniref:patatin-like phospholipase family protein n=1 Tax=Phytohabitans sp. LJ34 TaxID=3452217 RepID=UPI003F8B6740